ncbi:MAG TPA: HNH endonuclease family protein, partial [Intrasporangium sp.]|nr:HNH endonuclease family protein [Intrasporangium sp.]
MSAKPRNRLIWVALVLGAVIAIPRLGEALPSADEQAPSATSPTVVATGSATPQPEATAQPAPAQSSTGAPPSPSEPSSRPREQATRTPAARPGTALAAALTLTVKGRAPKTEYDRDQFGQAWLDTDRNGCDTRNDVLRRDLSNLVLKAGTRGCLVLRGTLNDPYTGKRIAFVRGGSTSGAVQIDHVVALADAWQKGAQQWAPDRRATFANDPLNLLAVDGPTNGRKGAGDTATWLPPNTSYRCAYVARQVAVKVKYRLWATAAERDAMVRVLTPCPNQPLPV